MTVYIDKAGWRVEANRTPEGVDFHQEGGGFVYSMPTENFDELFTLAPEKTWRRGTVTAEFLGEGVKLACWSDGSLWNGFGMPYFERAEVDRLIRHLNDNGMPLRWDGDKVVAVVGDEEEVYEPSTVEGVTVWPIGAGAWCWDQIDFGDAPERRRLYALDEQQHATVLAALRYYQKDLAIHGAPLATVHNIATNAGKFEPLDADQIDDLTMDLNHSGLGPREAARILEACYGTDQ